MQQPTNQRSIRGIVRKFNAQSQGHQGGGSTLIWTFRVIRFDENQNELPPVPVEIRSHEITGIIADGDDVEIQAVWAPPAILSVSKLYNHTTGSEVTSKKMKKLPKGCVVIPFIIIVCIIAYIIFRSIIGK